MFEDYDDYDDEVDDEFLYDVGSDDDEYFMNRDGEIVYRGDVYEDYYDYVREFAKPAGSRSQEKDENPQTDEAKDNLEKNKGLVADRISPFLNNTKFSDVTLGVGPHQFPAHKIILCSWSEVFRKMFIDPTWMSPRKGETNGPGPELQVLMEPEECLGVFSHFLKFMYTETVNLGMENVYPILTLADKYMVQELRDTCEDFLIEAVANVSGEEALKAYTEAERLGLRKVQEKCVRILEANVNYLSESCVQSMYIDLFVILMSSSNLVVEEEQDIFNMALRWLNMEGQQARRVQHTEEIFSLVRFQHIPSEKLKGLVDLPLPLFLESDFRPQLNGLIAKAFEWRALVAEEAYTVMEADYIEPRIYQNPAFSLHSAKGFMTQNSNNNYRKLSLFTEDTDDSFYPAKLSFRVASATEKNVFKFNKSAWEVSGTTKQESSSAAWCINYVVQTSQEIGNPYRMAVLTRLTEEDEGDLNPVITLHTGTVQEKFTLPVHSGLFGVVQKPTKVWIKLIIFISAKCREIRFPSGLTSCLL